MDQLARHIERLARTELAADQTLAVDLLDVDLAGYFKPWRFGLQDLRILRQTTWPRITLRYALTENGRVLLHGVETVSDVNYLDHTGYYFAGDPGATRRGCSTTGFAPASSGAGGRHTDAVRPRPVSKLQLSPPRVSLRPGSRQPAHAGGARRA